MVFQRTGLIIRALLIVLSFGFVSLGEDAFARAGSKRSFGRSQPTTAPRSNPPPSQHQQPMQAPPAVNPGRGAFMKGLAGGLAGGLLGSMLFSSFGHAAGLGGAGGGGIGFLDIILIGGILFLLYRLWKSRQNRPATYAAAGPMSSAGVNMNAYNAGPQDTGYFGHGVGQNPAPYAVSSARIDRDTAEDIFFRVQGAWTRRDLNLVQEYLDRDVTRVLETDLQELKAKNSINRLENISVRQIEIGESWFEGDREFNRVRFTASLLDYTVDETSGAIKEGSSSEPVKFDEYWVFAKSQGRSNWQLAGIEQV